MVDCPDVSQSSIFSSEPPCYAKPATSSPSSSAAAKTFNAAQVQREQDIVQESKRLEEERLQREAELREKEELEIALAAAESAKIASEEQKVRDFRTQLTNKIQGYLHTFYNEAREEIRNDLKEQSKLEAGEKTIAQQKSSLAEAKIMIQSQITQLDEQISKMTEAVECSKQQAEPDVDSLAIPTNLYSRQMLRLIATNASISDCLYYLDKGLVRGKLRLDEHLKQVRNLGKQQFMVRAHLMKVIQVQANKM